MVIATIRAERDEKANPHHPKWKQAVTELEQNGYAIIENAISAEQVSRSLIGASHCVSQPLLALTAHCVSLLTVSHCISLCLTVSHCSLYLIACLAGARDYLKEVTRDDSANALTFSADFLDMIDVPDVLDVAAHWLGPNLYVNHSHVASRPAGVSLTLSDCHYSLHFWLTLSRLAAHLSLSFSLCTLTKSHTPTLPHTPYHLYTVANAQRWCRCIMSRTLRILRAYSGQIPNLYLNIMPVHTDPRYEA